MCDAFALIEEDLPVAGTVAVRVTTVALQAEAVAAPLVAAGDTKS